MANNDISNFHAFNAVVVFQNLPNVQFNVQKFAIPSSAIGVTEVRKGFGKTVNLQGTSFNYEPLRFSWTLEESMDSYFDVHDWMLRIANPGEVNSVNEVGDCSIQIYNNNSKLIRTINFSNAWPISLSDIQLDTTVSDDALVIVDAQFEFDLMTRG